MSGAGAAPYQVQCPDRPCFHLHPALGWVNDPNGPVYYKGRYHMFYQHLPNACAWDFGIVWGHAVSTDLIHWEHLPAALVPTPGWVDADGCFSGCCVIDYDGRPTILYTGVRLRSNAQAGPLPPPEHDLGLVWIESQCAAVPEDPDDDLLIRWRKLEQPFLALPPNHIQLTGWRDPFIYRTHSSSFEKNGFHEEFRMLIGSGVKGQGGTALVYRSKNLLEGGWELVGQLCTGSSLDTGFVWECPIVVPLEPVPAHLGPPRRRHPPRWLIDRIGRGSSASLAAAWAAASAHSTHSGGAGALGGGLGGSSIWKQASGGSLMAGSSAAISPISSPRSSLPTSPFSAKHGGRQGPLRALAPTGLALEPAEDADSGTAAAALASSADAAPAAAEGGKAAGSEAGGAAEGREAGQDGKGEEEEGGMLVPDALGGGSIFEFSLGPLPPLAAPNAALEPGSPGRLASGQRQQQVEAGTAEAAAAAAPSGAAAGGMATAPSLSEPQAQSQPQAPARPSSRASDNQGPGSRPPSVASLRPPGPRPEMERAYTLEAWQSGVSSGAGAAHGSDDEEGAGGEGGDIAAALPGEPLSPAGSDSDLSTAPSFEFSLASPPESLPLSPDGTGAGSRGDAHPLASLLSSPGAQLGDSSSHELPHLSLEGEPLGAAASGLPPLPQHPLLAGLTQGGGSPSKSPPRGPTAALPPPPLSIPAGGFLARAPSGDGFDTVAAALSRVPRIKPKKLQRSPMGSQRRFPSVAGSMDSLPPKWGQQHGKQGRQQAQQERPCPKWHLFTVSPDAPTNPVLYWIGLVDEKGLEFELEHAKGPFRLDLGDVLYAPNVLQDDQGRWLLWGWLQERRKVGSYDYSGCMSLPRVLHVTHEGRLIQAPAPEVQALRSGHTWHVQQMPLPPNVLTPIPAVSGQALDIEVSIERGSASAVGLLFRSWQAEAEGGTAVVYDWERGVLEAIFNVPPSYGATPTMGSGIPGVGGEEGGEEYPVLDPAELLTPRFRRGAGPASSAAGGGGGRLSRTGSMASLRAPLSKTSSFINPSHLEDHPSLLQPETARAARLGGTSFNGTPRSPRTPLGAFGGGGDDEDLGFLLEELSEPMRQAPAEPQELRRVGGPLSMTHSDPLHLRVFVDGSCVEIYTGSGEVLSTRIYRGEPPPGADSGIEFVSFGGVATLLRAEAHEMGSAWEAAGAAQHAQQGTSTGLPTPATASKGPSLLTSPRHVIHPSDTAGAAGPMPAGLSEEDFRAAVAAALGGDAAAGGAGGSGVASPRAAATPRFEELIYVLSPRAAAY